MKRLKQTIAMLLSLVCVMMYTSCSDDNTRGGQDPDDPGQEGVTTEKAMIPSKLMEFSIGMLGEMAADANDNENMACSPMSTTMALSMLANGANGNTRRQILDLMMVPGADITDLNDVCRRMIADNKNVPGATCQLSNSMWIDSGFPVLPAFTQTLKDIYGAEVANVNDLTSDDTRERINNWINTNTGGLLPNFLEQNIPEKTVALINAINFAAFWNAPFDPNDTQKKAFTNYDGSTTQADMMSQKADKVTCYQYYADSKMTVLEMGLAMNHYNLMIILPNERCNMRDFLKEFTSESLGNIFRNSSTCFANIELPRFSVNYGAGLIPFLKRLGMQDAFDPYKANFKNLTERDKFYISLIQQKTKFIVDEEGVKAASATIVNGNGVDINQFPTVDFKVDRPFAFILYSPQNFSVLFNGYVNKL